MKRGLMLMGAALGGWRRGLGGAVLGAGLGYAAGCLLEEFSAAMGEKSRLIEAEEHYARYPEEEIIDALQAGGGGEEAGAMEFDLPAR